MPRRLLPAFIVAFSLLLPLFTAKAYPGFANNNFKDLWEYSDKPVAEVPGTGRGYTWGPNSFGQFQEEYLEAPGNKRPVQYFDKSRMELGANGTLVTNGLLTKELVTGQRQDGDNKFTQLLPSTVQVAGDPNRDGANAMAPSYASFKGVVTFFQGVNTAPNRTGQKVDQSIDKAGLVTTLSNLPEQLEFGYYEPKLGHNVPTLFVDFQNQLGPVWSLNSASYQVRKIYTDNPTANVFGYPISEPYWTRAVVAGQERDVLVQLFERRVLTYTPSNPDHFKVEMGNIGQHYYQWRYSTQSDPSLSLIAANMSYAPLTAGNVLLKVETSDKSTLYASDLAGKNSFIVTTLAPGHFFSGLTSDGKQVVWIEITKLNDTEFGPDTLRGFNLETRQEFTILQGSGYNVFGNLAMGDGVLYYTYNGTERTGFFARNLNTRQEDQIGDLSAHFPVVKEGYLLWTRIIFPSDGGRAIAALYMLKTDRKTAPVMLAIGPQGFSGYDFSGGNVVWAFSDPGEQNKVFLYNINSGSISSGAVRELSSGEAYNPKIYGKVVAWEIRSGALQVYRLDTGITTTFLEDRLPQLVGLIDEHNLLFICKGPVDQGQLFQKKFE